MKVAIAVDSFKGSVTSLAAGYAIQSGINRIYKDAIINVIPVGDGGEGTLEALTLGLNGQMVTANVTGPLGDKVSALYGLAGNAQTAIIEMSTAAGITLVPREQLNPLNTTTYGVGELIKDAIEKGCRNFIVGIGGSATNDGGIGMLTALGYRFIDKAGNPVALNGAGLADIVRIDTSNALPELSECSFRIACDVTNPLCGSNGCSAIYGPQKGATEQIVAQMDKWLYNYAKLTHDAFPQSDMDYPGSGAAGGLGFAFRSYLNASLEPGIEIVLDTVGLEKYVKDSDIVITGEGRLDAQTMMGKVPAGVATLAKRYNKPVIAFAGCIGEGAKACNGTCLEDRYIDAYFPILQKIVSLDEALDTDNTKSNLADTAEQVFRLIKTFGNIW